MFKIRLLLRNISVILFYPFFIGLVSFLTLLFFFSANQQDKVLVLWGKVSCKWFGIHLKIYGKEYPPSMGSCIYLFNHKSLVDIIILSGFLKYQSRFGAKKELFKIPLFGQALRAMGTLMIDRENRQKSIEAYQKGSNAISNGMRFVLSPEGGRQLASHLQPFKSGPFIFAISNGIPLVPIVIKGADKVLPKGRLLPNVKQLKRTVEVHILEPISSKSFSFEQRHRLKEKVFEEMKKCERQGMLIKSS